MSSSNLRAEVKSKIEFKDGKYEITCKLFGRTTYKIVKPNLVTCKVAESIEIDRLEVIKERLVDSLIRTIHWEIRALK